MTGEMDQEWVRRKRELEEAQKATRYEGEKSSEDLSETNSAKDSKLISATVDKIEVLSHWKGNLSITLVTDFTNYPRGGIPEPLKKRV